MLNYSGSIRYDQHGRKRKTKALKARSSSSVRTHGFHPCNIGSNPVRATKQYKSASMTLGSHDAKAALQAYKEKMMRQEESKNFTVAPAYNKGAYQVIPRSDVQHIGK